MAKEIVDFERQYHKLGEQGSVNMKSPFTFRVDLSETERLRRRLLLTVTAAVLLIIFLCCWRARPFL